MTIKAILEADTQEFIERVVNSFNAGTLDMMDSATMPGGIGVTCTQVITKGNFTFVEFTYDEDVNSVVTFNFRDKQLVTVTVREHTINGQRTKTLVNNGVPDARQKQRNLKF